jgi:hypothetical protein
MKYLLSTIIISLWASVSYSQTLQTDTTKPYLEDYSNKKWSGKALTTSGIDFLRTKSSTLVLINNKMFKIDDREFTALDPSKIEKMDIIKDESSKSCIKYVIMITTKSPVKAEQ